MDIKSQNEIKSKKVDLLEEIYEELDNKIKIYQTNRKYIPHQLLKSKYKLSWEKLNSDINSLLFKYFTFDMNRNLPVPSEENKISELKKYKQFLLDLLKSVKKRYRDVIKCEKNKTNRKAILSEIKEELVIAEIDYCRSRFAFYKKAS